MLKDTIVALATPPGIASVGIIRVSGPNVKQIAEKVLGQCPSPRVASYLPFFDLNHSQLDQGIALYFCAPHSFTGEDILELQGHGGPIVMQMVLDTCIATGLARMARPGEFSEQAFLNDKLDLAQAEAIADLINASSQQAAKSALRSLKGEFSESINALVDQLIRLRMYVEASIDFPEEEINFLADEKIQTDLNIIIQQLKNIQQQANQGSILRDGMQVVIVGKPNAGKSSLLNALAGRDAAIVTDIAGTTRDVLREHIHIDGMPLHIIDTAGIRNQANDEVERIGMQRAWEAASEADQILFVIDASIESNDNMQQLLWDLFPEFTTRLPDMQHITIIRNKCDLTNQPIAQSNSVPTVINISARQNLGIDLVRSHLKQVMGFTHTGENQIIARKRHLIAINNALTHVQQGKFQLTENMAGDLLAEELRLAQIELNEITGEFSSDDLLGRIFSSFCIGK